MRSRGWLLLGLVALLPLGACDDDHDGDPPTGPEPPGEMEELVDEIREHVPSGDEGCEACHVSVAAILDGTDVVDTEVS